MSRSLNLDLMLVSMPFFSVLCLILLSGCGGAAPEILFADAQVFLVQDLEEGSIGERLRLYVAVDDGDGITDLSVISVVHDRSDLYWQASAEEWVVIEQDGDSWIGLPDLRPIHGETLPRGRYRVILEDNALQEVEGTFGITAPPLVNDSVVFPSLRVTGPIAEVLSPAGGQATDGQVADGLVVIRVYTRAGRLAISREVSAGPLGQDMQRDMPAETGLQIYLSSPPGNGVRLMSGPFELNR